MTLLMYMWHYSYTCDSTCTLKQYREINLQFMSWTWVMSHLQESCHMYMTNFTYTLNRKSVYWKSVGWSTFNLQFMLWTWVMSHVHESCHMKTSNVSYIKLKKRVLKKSREFIFRFLVATDATEMLPSRHPAKRELRFPVSRSQIQMEKLVWSEFVPNILG